ncbi:hypothetical protein [Methanosarcina acetivorans]|uniref:Uncharacterized protein n=1 Tax=Methanosarcina acetivorans (strain ATCC 35395 / DSM 2834 / JCM 12185 / C2A) TaxID=188937 RepID=Q8TP04_METAC|nr:hypothetical protein [Methanosarcina acetivorans]AAM05521.1 predicted protein [Methanosarcina acetivorans C2A]
MQKIEFFFSDGLRSLRSTQKSISHMGLSSELQALGWVIGMLAFCIGQRDGVARGACIDRGMGLLAGLQMTKETG